MMQLNAQERKNIVMIFVLIEKKMTNLQLTTLKIATFNIQGCKTNSLKIKSVVRDAEKYGIQIMGVTETHIYDMELVEIKGEKKLYNIYHNGITDTNKYKRPSSSVIN